MYTAQWKATTKIPDPIALSDLNGSLFDWPCALCTVHYAIHGADQPNALLLAVWKVLEQ